MSSSGKMTGPKTAVLFVQTKTHPPLGADTWVQLQVIRALDRSSHQVHVAYAPGRSGHPTPTATALSQISDVEVVPVNLGPELHQERSLPAKLSAGIRTVPAILGVLKLARYVRRHDIALIHTTDRPRDAFVCVLLARITGAKCVIHAHVAYGDWMSGMLKWSLKRADALVGVSRFVAESLVNSGHDGRRVYAVLNAIDIDRWVPGRGRPEARASLGVEDRTPVVITVCRLFPGKGPGELIRAMGVVAVDEPDARLVVVGEDMTPDGSYTRELAALARELGIDDRVHLTGRRDDVPELMAAADVFGMPSFEEPFGLVYLEAMAMELPVVALDNGGTPEVVEDGSDGFLTSPGETKDFAAHLLRLIRDPDLRRRMGAHGRQHVLERFLTPRMAQDVATVYRRILASGNDRPVQSEGATDASLVSQ